MKKTFKAFDLPPLGKKRANSIYREDAIRFLQSRFPETNFSRQRNYELCTQLEVLHSSGPLNQEDENRKGRWIIAGMCPWDQCFAVGYEFATDADWEKLLADNLEWNRQNRGYHREALERYRAQAPVKRETWIPTWYRAANLGWKRNSEWSRVVLLKQAQNS